MPGGHGDAGRGGIRGWNTGDTVEINGEKWARNGGKMFRVSDVPQGGDPDDLTDDQTIDYSEGLRRARNSQVLNYAGLSGSNSGGGANMRALRQHLIKQFGQEQGNKAFNDRLQGAYAADQGASNLGARGLNEQGEDVSGELSMFQGINPITGKKYIFENNYGGAAQPAQVAAPPAPTTPITGAVTNVAQPAAQNSVKPKPASPFSFQPANSGVTNPVTMSRGNLHQLSEPYTPSSPANPAGSPANQAPQENYQQYRADKQKKIGQLSPANPMGGY